MSLTALPPLSPPERPRMFGAPNLHTDGELIALGIAADGTLWSIEEPGELRGWNLHTRRHVHSFPLDVAAMVWSFNWAVRLVASGSEMIAVWEVHSGSQLSVWSSPSWVSALAFQPGAPTLASGHDDGVVRVWDWAEQKLIAEMSTGKWPISAMAFSWDGKILACASEDRLVHLWDFASRKHIGTLQGHKDRIPTIAWHPDNKRVFTAGWDTTVRVWNAQTCEPIILLNSHATQVHSLAISADGKLLASADSDNAVHIWDTDRHETMAILREPTGEIHCLAFTPDDNKGNLTPAILAWGGADRIIHLWDSRQIPDSTGGMDALLERTQVVVDPKGKTLYSLGSGTDLRLWDIASGNTLAQLEGEPRLRTFALSPDGKWIAAARLSPPTESEQNNRTSLSLYNAETGARSTVCEGQAAPITALAFNSDSTLLAAGGIRSSDVWLWSVPAAQPILLIPDAIAQCSVEAMAFQPGAGILAIAGIDWMATSGKDGRVVLWNINTRQSVSTLEGGATAIVYHPSGDKLITAGLDRKIHLWDLQSNQVIRDFVGHTETITDVAISADGQYLASCSDDRTLRLWDLETGEQLSAWELDNALKSVTFSPDGKYLFTGNGNTSCYQIEVERMLSLE